MDSEFTLYLPTPIGHLKLEFQDKKLFSLYIIEFPPLKDKKEKLVLEQEDKIVQNTSSLLNQYFRAAVSFLPLSLAPQGTAFQRSVWHALTEIPLGETCTYGDIAKKLNSSPRAVGNACRKNPIQIIVPCHRVVSAKGLGGYSGATEGKQLNIKRWLLHHEGVIL